MEFIDVNIAYLIFQLLDSSSKLMNNFAAKNKLWCRIEWHEIWMWTRKQFWCLFIVQLRAVSILFVEKYALALHWRRMWCTKHERDIMFGRINFWNKWYAEMWWKKHFSYSVVLLLLTYSYKSQEFSNWAGFKFFEWRWFFLTDKQFVWKIIKAKR